MKNLHFDVHKSNSEILKYFRTPTTISSSLHPSITVIKNIPYLMVPQANSYIIYTLQDLKISFFSSIFDEIDAILQSGVFVYVLCKDLLYKTYRGEILTTFKFSEPKTTQKTQIVKFGEFFCVLFNNKIHVFECSEDNANYSLVNDESEKLQDTLKEENDFSQDTTYNTHFIRLLYVLEYNKNVISIMHPKSYINKILIVFDDGSSELFNLNSKKVVFNFNFEYTITSFAQTSIFDVFGFASSTGMISIFNLKKNVEVLNLSFYKNKDVVGIDFYQKYMLVLYEENKSMSIYDMDLQKEVFLRKNILSAIFISETAVLFITSNSVEIFDLENLQILKKRMVLNKTVTDIKQYSENEIILKGDTSLFVLNLGRDEMNRFLKVKNTPIVSLDSNENILINSNNAVSYIDRNLKFKNFINMKFVFSKTYLDFCMLCKKSGTNETFTILIMNLKSKRVILKFITTDFISGDFDNNSFTILSSNKLTTYNYDCKIIQETFINNNTINDIKECTINKNTIDNNTINNKSIDKNSINDIKECTINKKDIDLATIKSEAFVKPINEGLEETPIYRIKTNNTFKSVSKHGNIYCLQGPENIFVVSKNDMRVFKGSAYSLSKNLRIIATVSNNNIYLYDTVSGNMLECVETNTELRSIVIVNSSDTFKYIAVLDKNSQVHVFSNLSHFNSMKNFQEIKIGLQDVDSHSIKKRESVFYKELVIFKGSMIGDIDLLVRSLDKNQVENLVSLILKNIENDFLGTQRILNQILTFKQQFVKIEDLLEIQKKIEKYVEDYENKVLRTLSYLKLEKNNLI